MISAEFKAATRQCSLNAVEAPQSILEVSSTHYEALTARNIATASSRFPPRTQQIIMTFELGHFSTKLFESLCQVCTLCNSQRRRRSQFLQQSRNGNHQCRPKFRPNSSIDLNLRIELYVGLDAATPRKPLIAGVIPRKCPTSSTR